MATSLRVLLVTLAVHAGLFAYGLLPLAASAQVTWTYGSGGSTVDGSGNAVDQPRVVGPFRGLVVNGPVDVRLKAGNAQRVVVHADDNIVPLIQTQVVDDKLVVDVMAGASFRTRSRMYAEVTFRELSSVLIKGSGDVRADRIVTPIFETTIRGSGDVVIDALESDAVALSISGSGDFTAAGRAPKLGVVIVGSGDVRADKLEAQDVAVRIRGSGDVRVHATNTLQVDIAGSGDVRYRGEPTVTKKVAGSGDVAPLR
jgi:hypothetical protein